MGRDEHLGDTILEDLDVFSLFGNSANLLKLYACIMLRSKNRGLQMACIVLDIKHIDNHELKADAQCNFLVADVKEWSGSLTHSMIKMLCEAAPDGFVLLIALRNGQRPMAGRNVLIPMDVCHQAFHYSTQPLEISFDAAKFELSPRTGRIENMNKWVCNMCDRFFSQAKMSKCSMCLLYRYCSRECQAKDWPGHKIHCKQIGALINVIQ